MVRTGYSKIFRYRHFLALKMLGKMAVKKTKMFRPIAVRNGLTTPYGLKVLGNLKQCSSTPGKDYSYSSSTPGKDYS